MATLAEKIGRDVETKEAKNLTRAFGVLARCLMESEGRPAQAWKYAESRNVFPLVTNILKSAVAAGTTTNQNWASELADYQLIAQAFLGSLAPFSAFDAALADFIKVPFHTRIEVITSAATASVVGELEPKPLTKLQLAESRLVERKAVAICAVTNELIRSSAPGALDLITNELRKAVAAKTDEVFLDILTQTTGISTASSLEDALDEIEFGADARLYLVLPPAAAKAFVFERDSGGPLYPGIGVNGGVFADIKFVVSNAASAGVLFDARQIAANSDTITIDASSQADIQLDDAPTGGATNLTSLFQSNRKALKAERYFGAEVLRAEAVCKIEGVTA